LGKGVIRVSCKDFEDTELQAGDLRIAFRIRKSLSVGLFENGVDQNTLARMVGEQGGKRGSIREWDFNHKNIAQWKQDHTSPSMGYIF